MLITSCRHQKWGTLPSSPRILHKHRLFTFSYRKMSSVIKTESKNTQIMGSLVSVISSNFLFQNMPVPKNPDLNFSSFSPSWNSLGSIPSTDIYKSTKNYKNVSAFVRHWLDLGLLSWIFRGCIFLFQYVRDKVAKKGGYFCWESPEVHWGVSGKLSIQCALWYPRLMWILSMLVKMSF